jgi:Zn-dependent peptidase ImmA (M78 family)
MTSVEPTKFRFLTNELIALSRSRHPDKSSWQAVKQGILRAATYLREEAGQISAPIMLEKIEKLRYIQKKVIYDSEGASGAILEPISGGFIIRLGKGQTNIRRRFGVAHEIGHTFFYNLDYDPPVKIFPRESSRLLIDKKEEGICNTFAGELLIPGGLVLQDIANSSERNLKMIIDLAAKYVISPEVTARRLILDLSEFKNSILLFKEPYVTKGKAVWWFYGSTLRRYLRKDEKAIFRQIVQAIQEGPEPQSLKHTMASNKMVSIEHYQTLPNSRLMTLVTFKRDDSSTVSPLVSSKVESQ